MQALTEIINRQIMAAVGGITTPVVAVTSAVAMHLNDIADAYAGNCPDQTSDVKMLDLDGNYITLLDSLRRTRPYMYKVLANAAIWWHNHPLALLDQPASMMKLSDILMADLQSEKHNAHCSPDDAIAVAAALSTAIPPHPDQDEKDVEAAAAEAAAEADQSESFL